MIYELYISIQTEIDNKEELKLKLREALKEFDISIDHVVREE